MSSAASRHSDTVRHAGAGLSSKKKKKKCEIVCGGGEWGGVRCACVVKLGVARG